MRRILLSVQAALLIVLSGLAADKDNGAGGALSKYPQTEIQNHFLKARLYLPDELGGYYRGTRFDWSGLISKVEYGSHSFFSEFKQEHDPLNHDDICGTAEEFDIDGPASFSEAKAGQPFLKIGVGVLERPDDTGYAFWKRYKILTAGKWKIERAPDKVSFQQDLKGPNGWAYDYTKTIEIDAGSPVVRIVRRLKNTGTRPIETSHYGHNFLRIDDLPTGTNYTFEFPFQPRLASDSRPQGCVAVKGLTLMFTTNPPPEVAIWVRMEGFQRPEDNEIKVINRSAGATMTISGDQPLSRLAFYSSGGVLCPEPFVRLVIAPGTTRSWTTTYRFRSEKP